MSELELVTCQGARARGSTAATHLVQRLVMVGSPHHIIYVFTSWLVSAHPAHDQLGQVRGRLQCRVPLVPGHCLTSAQSAESNSQLWGVLITRIPSKVQSTVLVKAFNCVMEI